MSTNDYVKFLTKELVSFMDKKPKIREEEFEVELEEDEEEEESVSFATTLFGNIPMGLKMAIQRNVQNESEKENRESDKTTG